MSTTPFFTSQPRPGDSRLRQLVLESAVTLRNCSLGYWITEQERQAWRSHMRTEALKWRHLARMAGEIAHHRSA